MSKWTPEFLANRYKPYQAGGFDCRNFQKHGNSMLDREKQRRRIPPRSDCRVFPPLQLNEAPYNTMVETAEQPPSCYRRRPPGPLQRLGAALFRLRDGLCLLSGVSLRSSNRNCSADFRFERLSVSPLCLSLAGSISLTPARAYRVWLAAAVRAGQLLPLQFVRRFTRR